MTSSTVSSVSATRASNCSAAFKTILGNFFLSDDKRAAKERRLSAKKPIRSLKSETLNETSKDQIIVPKTAAKKAAENPTSIETNGIAAPIKIITPARGFEWIDAIEETS